MKSFEISIEKDNCNSVITRVAEDKYLCILEILKSSQDLSNIKSVTIKEVQ